MAWISVKDSLPKVKKVSHADFKESAFCFIFVTTARGVHYDVAQYTVPTEPDCKAHWDTRDGFSYDTESVTHWQIPKPPLSGGA